MTEKHTIKKPTTAFIVRVLFSLLCALLLWVYVTSSPGNNYTQTFSNVSVVYEGETSLRESRGLVVTERYTSTVRVTIQGSRRAVSRLSASDLTAVVSLNDIYNTGYKDKTYTISYPAGTDSGSMEITARSPSVVSFEVDSLSTRTVPVTGVFNGSTAPGYSAQTLEFSPNTVTISGPQKAISSVDHAWIEISRDDVDKPLSYESDYVLMDAEDNVIEDESIVLETPTVEVTLPIIAIKEVDLTVKLIEGGGATAADVKVDIEPKTITLSGDADALSGVNNIDIATIDLAAITESSFTETYRIVIPNDTEIISGVQEATLTLEIMGLETKQVNVTNFSVTNVTDGYAAQIISEGLSVTLRGPADVLRGISDNNVRAVADLTDYGEATGILSVPAKIVIDGTTQAGAVGQYILYVRVTVKDTE